MSRRAELEFFTPSESLPDDETTVLMGLDTGETWPGYLSGGEWFSADATQPEAKVIEWAHMPVSAESQT